MTEFKEYVQTGVFLDLYDESSKGHALNFLYLLLCWMERDKADTLYILPKRFAWYKKRR
ncbi:MAG: hypothetical protein AAFV98_22800 [Chloroflexota bacterium]